MRKKSARSSTAHLTTLQELAAQLDQRQGPAVVIFNPDNSDARDFNHLSEDVHRMALTLLGTGIKKKDTRIAIYARNSYDWIVGCLGIFRSGTTIVPIDAQFRGQELQHVISDSGVQLILTDTEGMDHIKNTLGKHSPDMILLEKPQKEIKGIPFWRDIGIKNKSNRFFQAAGRDQAAIFYTSGTTGKPKGVPLTHSNLLYQLKVIEDSDIVKKNFRVLQPLPLHHVYSFVIGLLAPVALACPVVLPAALTGPQLLRAIRVSRATAMIGVPGLYQAILEGVRRQKGITGPLQSMVLKAATPVNLFLRRRLRLNIGRQLLYPLHRQVGTSLQLLASGGAPLDPDVEQQLIGYGWDVAIGYGLTETSPLLTIKRSREGKTGSVGRPVKGTEIRIDTSATQQESSSRSENEQVGEILARGTGVFAGYRHLKQETAESFTGDGWFRTGDLGYLDGDNYLYVKGRLSTLMVLPGGENVQPESVEKAYAEHPVIREIGILQQGKRLAALLVPDQQVVSSRYNGDMNTAVNDALHQQSQKVPSYMHVAEYATTTEALPRTRLGKIRRHLLEEQYVAAREREQQGPRKKGALPVEEMSEQDQQLLSNPSAGKIWEMFKQRYKNMWLTPDTDLRAGLGIDSLYWVNLTLDIRRETGVELSEEAMTRARTVRDLLQEVGSGGAGEAPPPLDELICEPEKYLSPEQKKWLRPLSVWQRAIRAFTYLLLSVTMKAVFRIQVSGRENIPLEGPIVLAPNHTSHLDPPALAVALGYRRLHSVYWAGWAGIMLRNAVMRLITRLSKTVPVEPGRSASSSLTFGSLLLKQGKTVVWFPEGERSPNGNLQPLRGGLGLLLRQQDAAIVPVWIDGAFQALPRGKIIPNLHRIKVIFGEPFHSSDISKNATNEQEAQELILGDLKRRLLKMEEKVS